MRKRLYLAVLYTALALGANPALADSTAARAALQGPMQALALHDAPKALPDVPLEDLAGQAADLSPYRGQWVVLNFWATWCAPCREELPGLARLGAAMEGQGLAVVTIATGPNPKPAIQRFLAENGLEGRFPVLCDPRSRFAHGLGIMGLPVTLILNPEGQEVGRLMGEAAWDSAEAEALLTALMAP